MAAKIEEGEFKATHRYAPMTARKARTVMDMVRGMGVDKALETLEYVHRRAAPMISKVIKSAAANAAQVGGVEARDLFIKTGLVNEGPLKQNRLRWRPGPMGRAMPIRKRSCHIEVVLAASEKAASTRRKPAPEVPEDGDEGSN